MRSLGFAVLALVAVAACSAASDDERDDDADEGALTFYGVSVDGYDKTLPDVDAIGYETELSVDEHEPGHERYAASVKGTYVTTRELSALDRHFEGGAIDGVQVNGRAAPFTRQGSVLHIDFGRRIASGKPFDTKVTYHGDFFQADDKDRDDFAGFGGLMVARRTRAEKAIYASVNWPSKARRWLPLRDHPRDGAMFTMKARFPKRLTVVANGKRTSVTDNRDDTRTWSYAALTPMPTYDFFVAASDSWSEKSLGKVAQSLEVVAYAYERDQSLAQAIFADAPKAMDFYTKTFGAYRWGDRLSYLEIPMYAGGMENATVVGMDETLFAGAAAEGRQITFHELAHHWSGNLVRYGTWNDFWLSEGFTEYLTRRAVLAYDGPAAARKLWRTTMRDALAAEAEEGALHAVRPPDPERDVLTFFDDIVYEKGAWVLKMLEDRVGIDRLTAFLKSWFERHAFGHVTTKDFEAEVQRETGIDLARFFADWVYGEYHPELEVTWARVDAANVDVTVRQVQTKGPAAGFALPFEVELTRGSSKERVQVDLKERSAVKRVAIAWDPERVTPDPDEHSFATTTCDETHACKPNYACNTGMCSPR